MVRPRKIAKRTKDGYEKEESNLTSSSGEDQDDCSNQSSGSGKPELDAVTPKYNFRDNMLQCSCEGFQFEEIRSPEPFFITADSASSALATTDSSSAKCCVKQRNFSSLANECFCDVTFLVGKGDKKRRMSAHKAFLSPGSDVFKTMFSENWSPASGEIEVPEVEVDAFANLVRYLYTDVIMLTDETVEATFYAAKKYWIVPVEKQCLSYMAEHLCPKNVFDVFKFARSFDEKKLITSCIKIIDEDTDAAVSANGFLDIDSASLLIILERDNLNIREIALFNAVLRWCSAECERRSLAVSQESQKLVLKEILRLIRFPLMSPEEISCVVAPLGILTHEELMSLYYFYFTNPKPPVNFNSTPRFWQSFKVCRFQETAMPFVYSEDTKTVQAIGFKVDSEVRFSGVSLYGPVSVPAQYSVRLALLCGTPVKCIHLESSVLSFDKAAFIFEVLFKNSFKLKPGLNYVVWMTIQGPPSFYGKKGLQKFTETLSHERHVTINFFRINQSKQTTVNEGQIPELIFTT